MKKCTITFPEILGDPQITWTSEVTSLIQLVLNPSPEQMRARSATVPGAVATNLINFLTMEGVEVERVAENSETHSFNEIWSEKIWSVCDDQTDSEILSFLQEMGLTFRETQKESILTLYRNYFSVLSGICGFGKTLVQLTLAQIRKKVSGKVWTLIVAPTSCAGEYGSQLAQYRGHFDLTLDDLSSGNTEENIVRLELSTADVVVCSVDSLHRYVDTILKKLSQFDGETILSGDEIHYVKNLCTKRSRALQRIATHFDRVIVSTATPMPLGPKDIRGYLALVTTPQPIELYDSNRIPDRDMELLKKVAFVADETDLQFSTVKKEKLNYNDKHSRLDAVADEVQQEIASGGKVLLFCSTNEALLDLYNRFQGTPRVVLSGSYHTVGCMNEILHSGRNTAARRDAIKDFNENPNCKILIANYRVGSTGLNLQHSGAKLAIYYEVTNNGADLFQAEYRLRRPFVFPSGGFRFIYAVPTEAVSRNTVERQFTKLANQRQLLSELRATTRGTS